MELFQISRSECTNPDVAMNVAIYGMIVGLSFKMPHMRTLSSNMRYSGTVNFSSAVGIGQFCYKIIIIDGIKQTSKC